MFFNKNWWTFLFRGISYFLLGLFALLLPGLTLTTMIVILGILVTAVGVFTIIAAANSRKKVAGWEWILVSAVLSLLAGLVIIMNPFGTAMALVYLLAGWIFITGVAEIIMAIRLRNEVKQEAWYITAGIIAILLAFFIFIDPSGAYIILTILFGGYAVVAGCMLIYLSWRLKKRSMNPRDNFYSIL